MAHALTRLADTVGVPLPLPAEQLAVVLFAISNGLGIEAGIDSEAVPDELFGRVLTLIARDFVAAAQRSPGAEQ